MDVQHLLSAYGAWAFPPFFVAIWLLASVIFGLLSGWNVMMKAYPDTGEAPLLSTGWQSGSMGASWFPVSMSNVLRLEACSSGLRVGITRFFSPFSRPFLVPWSHIAVRRRTLLGWRRVDFQFGGRTFPTLSISGDLADELAQAAPSAWPEAAIPALQPKGQVVGGHILQWIALTAFAAAFFTFAPRLMGVKGAGPPPAVAILFPAAVFGVFILVRLIGRLSR